ncbi:hypothetical protein FA13DRAFT_1710854 [Coprinellus micaceus]|uniref:Uncharacterized protein n=1 Tax=Coprinellus micaceus TaxID=71717 RepID=A0A4Y7T7Q5_COPMI|nr:hypothetical protein FA13DRAFT_1710854 [Coprinellus micaceus]
MGVPGAKKARKRCKRSYQVKRDQRPILYSQYFGNSAQQYLPCVSFRIDSRDTCQPNIHVVVRPSIGEPYISTVEEILTQAGGAADPSGVLVCRWRRVDKVNAYDMLSIEAMDFWSLVPPTDVVCLANTQHDCTGCHCDATGRENIMQEGVVTDQARTVIKHKDPLEQCVLNTASMQDAHHLQQFQVPSLPFSEEQTLCNSTIALWVLHSTWARQTAVVRAAACSPIAENSQLPSTSAADSSNPPNVTPSSRSSAGRFINAQAPQCLDASSPSELDTLSLIVGMWQGDPSTSAPSGVHISRPVSHRVQSLRGEAPPKRRRPG